MTDDIEMESRVAIARLTKSLIKREPAAPSVVVDALKELGVSAPHDYIVFMTESDGAEGPIGHAGYLVLWPMEELVRWNQLYHVEEFAPQLVLIGSDGGDTAYALDRARPGAILSVPFIGMSADSTKSLSETFLGLLESIATS